MTFIDKWLHIIRNCSFDNTYKMAWSKAITEISLELDYRDTHLQRSEITLTQIAEKVIRYYWEQTIFFDLQQGSNPLKPPVIVSITKELIKSYQEQTRLQQPVKWLKANVEEICPLQYQKAISNIVKALKADVSYRFLKVSGKEVDGVYDYQQKADSLSMPMDNLTALKENSLTVFEAINYRWSQMLEGFNHSPRICKKVRIIDEEKVRRKPLSRFSGYLDIENPEHYCFLCKNKIKDETLSIDHIIHFLRFVKDTVCYKGLLFFFILMI